MNKIKSVTIGALFLAALTIGAKNADAQVRVHAAIDLPAPPLPPPPPFPHVVVRASVPPPPPPVYYERRGWHHPRPVVVREYYPAPPPVYYEAPRPHGRYYRECEREERHGHHDNGRHNGWYKH